jgi:hypothetical protein
MKETWKIERNTGSRAFIATGSLIKVVWRPQTMSRHDFSSLLVPGSEVDERVLRLTLEQWL